jgi:hypothetical protein
MCFFFFPFFFALFSEWAMNLPSLTPFSLHSSSSSSSSVSASTTNPLITVVTSVQYADAQGMVIKWMRQNRHRQGVVGLLTQLGYQPNKKLISRIQCHPEILCLEPRVDGGIIEYRAPCAGIYDRGSFLAHLKTLRPCGFVVTNGIEPYVGYKDDMKELSRLGVVRSVSSDLVWKDKSVPDEWPIVFAVPESERLKPNSRVHPDIKALWHNSRWVRHDIDESKRLHEEKKTVATIIPQAAPKKKKPKMKGKMTNTHMVGKGHEWVDEMDKEQKQNSRGGGGGGRGTTTAIRGKGKKPRGGGSNNSSSSTPKTKKQRASSNVVTQWIDI